jgi:hypothetical protein
MEVARFEAELRVTGLFPSYQEEDRPFDLMQQYEASRKKRSKRMKNDGKDSPHVLFANADNDEKLIAFVRRFGPVVAKSVVDTRMVPDPELGEPRLPGKLIAIQNLQELRNEQSIYRAALALIMEMSKEDFDYGFAQGQIAKIAPHIGHWPEQWERELVQRKTEPSWKIHPDSIKRIESFASARQSWMHPPSLDARIVICELLNVFRSQVFPNAIELHNTIEYGIRPLLYSILRREFLYPRDFGVCANTQCKGFFDIDREGQTFCSPECSLRQRQRDYWKIGGKQARAKRLKKVARKTR